MWTTLRFEHSINMSLFSLLPLLQEDYIPCMIDLFLRMAVNNHWMYQGQQCHQWFGHRTAPKEAKDEAGPAAPGSMFDPASVGQRVDYAVGHVVAEARKGKRSSWESRLSGNARNSIKAVIGVWYGGQSMSRNTFRLRLLEPYTSDETVDQLREAAKGIVEARIRSQLGEAGRALAVAVLNIGIDAWPRYLGDAERRGVAAASEKAIPGVIKASADGMDVPRAIGTGIVLGRIILYLRQKQEEAARQAGSKPTTTPSLQQPNIVEAAVKLQSPRAAGRRERSASCSTV